MVVGVSGSVDGVEVEGDCKALAKGGDEGLVGVGLFSSEGVVDVDGGERGSKGVAGESIGGVEEEQEGGRIGSAGDGAGDAVAGADGGGGEVHVLMMIMAVLPDGPTARGAVTS